MLEMRFGLAHVYRNVQPKLAGVRKENKNLGQAILADIESIQWIYIPKM